MRLLDKVLSQAPKAEREYLVGMAKQPEFACVVADEIARHYHENDQLEWGPDDYPYFVPPWTTSFIEWHESPRIQTEQGWMDGNPANQMGYWVVSFPQPESVAAHRKLLEQVTGTVTDDADYVGATKTVVLQPMIYGHSRLEVLRICFIVFTTDEGRIVRRAITGGDMEKYVTGLGVNEAGRFFDSMLHIAGVTLTFLNCKNVKLDDKTSILQPSDKVRRRLKLPEIKRYTLRINGHSTSRDNDKPQSEFGVMPFHLCRGHFANYTAEKPLFGRLVGKFWISAHMRGKRDRGEIVKDYAVNCG